MANKTVGRSGHRNASKTKNLPCTSIIPVPNLLWKSESFTLRQNTSIYGIFTSGRTWYLKGNWLSRTYQAATIWQTLSQRPYHSKLLRNTKRTWVCQEATQMAVKKEFGGLWGLTGWSKG